jgi:hypothetical protein
MIPNFDDVESAITDSGFLILSGSPADGADTWTPVAGLLAGLMVTALLLEAIIAAGRSMIEEHRVTRSRRTEVRARAKSIIHSAACVRSPPCASTSATVQRQQRVLVSGGGVEPGRQRAPI